MRRPGSSSRRGAKPALRASASSNRRGAGGIAIVIALVMLQLLIVGAIVAESRDQNMTKIRLDTTRAFYAAEAGDNMAVRECLTGIDEDHDGSIGTISSDGNANNDPALGQARLTVDRALVGGLTQLAARGRAG